MADTSTSEVDEDLVVLESRYEAAKAELEEAEGQLHKALAEEQRLRARLEKLKAAMAVLRTERKLFDINSSNGKYVGEAGIERLIRSVDRMRDQAGLSDESKKTLDDLRAELIAVRDEYPGPVRVSPLAYLRSMWTIFWTSFLFPRTSTAIDLTTGQIIEDDPDERA